MGLAVLFWTLGLSEWGMSHVLHALGAGIHRSSVHRDRLRAGALLRQREMAVGRVRVLGADETTVRVRGQAQLLGFVVDGESGKTIGVDVVVQQDSAAFRRWLQHYTQALGVEVLVTDDLATYRPVSHQLGLPQQVCLAHVRRWVAQRLRRIRGWDEEQALIRETVRAFKSVVGTLAGVALSQWLYSGATVHDLGELAA